MCQHRVVRRLLAWLVALPVMVVGSQVVHGVAYWWAYPQVDVRIAVLRHTGHGYLAYAPIVLAFLFAVEAVAFTIAVVDWARGRPLRSLPPSAFVLVPLIGFAVQEYLERFLMLGVFPWWAALEPSFWRGLVLQIPIGLIAFAIFRLLRGTATVVGRFVGGRRRPLPRSAGGLLARLPRPSLGLFVRVAPLAGAAAGRAPPSFVC
jgi:hypothetical protein